MSALKPFVLGATCALSLVVGLFFVRFWRRTRDRLFAAFAIAFFVLACDWGGLALISSSTADRPGLYAVRVIAFGAILWAIVETNFKRPPA